MPKIAIVIGHGPRRDTGAVNHATGMTELRWNKDLAQELALACSDRGLETEIVHRVTEKLQPVEETNATKADVAVELHLNSFNGIASGTEMIHAERSVKGAKLAKLLQAAAVSVLDLPDRGIKPPQGGGRGKRWLEQTDMPAVIVESFFIDNNLDLERGTARKVQLAAAYARAFSEFLNGQV